MDDPVPRRSQKGRESLDDPTKVTYYKSVLNFTSLCNFEIHLLICVCPTTISY